MKAMENPEKYLSNPVIAYLMVKRFSTDWQNAVELYFNNSGTQTSDIKQTYLLITMTMNHDDDDDDDDDDDYGRSS